VCRAQRSRGTRSGRRGVLDVLRLVEDHCRPVELAEELGVAPEQAIRREDDGASRAAERTSRSRALGAVVRHHLQRGSEALDLALPVADHGCGCDEERGGLGALPALSSMKEERQELHRLAEAHVVGEARAETERAHRREPGETAPLIRAQRRSERARHGDRCGGALAQRGDRSAERPDGRDLDHERALTRLARERGSQRLVHADTRRALGDARADLCQLGRIDRDPLAAIANERRLLGGEGGELGGAQHLVAEHSLPVHVDERVEREA
jgi:hypothetical protein